MVDAVRQDPQMRCVTVVNSASDLDQKIMRREVAAVPADVVNQMGLLSRLEGIKGTVGQHLLRREGGDRIRDH